MALCANNGEKQQDLRPSGAAIGNVHLMVTEPLGISSWKEPIKVTEPN